MVVKQSITAPPVIITGQSNLPISNQVVLLEPQVIPELHITPGLHIESKKVISDTSEKKGTSALEDIVDILDILV